MFGINRYRAPVLSGRTEQARVDSAPVGSVGAPGGALPVGGGGSVDIAGLVAALMEHRRRDNGGAVRG